MRTPLAPQLAPYPAGQRVFGCGVQTLRHGHIGAVILLQNGENAGFVPVLVAGIVEHIAEIHVHAPLRDGVRYDDHAAAALLFEQVIDTVGQTGDAEIVQREHQLHIAAGTSDAGHADQAVDPLGVPLVDLIDHILPSLLGGDVGVDIPAFQIDVDRLMSLAAQNFYRLAADAAGAAGDYINSHKLSVSFPRN